MIAVGHGTAHLPIIPGEPLGGYVDRASGASGVLDALEVHAVSVSGNGRRFVLIVVDLVCVNVDVVAEVRTALDGLGVDATWVSATHAHSTPEAGCFPGGAPTPQDLASRIVAASISAAASALAAEQPALLHTIRAMVPDVAGRRNIEVQARPSIPVDAIRFHAVGDDGAPGERIGTIVVTPVHPTVLGAENSLVSADLIGGIRRAVAAEHRGWVVAATGAAGDISTRTTRWGRDLAEIDRLAARIAAGLREANPDGEAVDSSGSELLLPRTRTVVLDAKREPAEPGARSDSGGDSFAQRRRAVLEQGIALADALLRRGKPAHYEVTVEAVAFAGVSLVAVPAELFLSLAERIRTEHPDDGPVIVLGYTNGYLGYLPDAAAILSYETAVSPVERGSGESVTAAALETLADLTATIIASNGPA